MNYVLLAILVLLNVLDVYYSNLAFKMGVDEANPVMSYIIENYSLTGMVLVKGMLLAVLAVLLAYSKSLLVTLMMIGVIGVYGWVIMQHVSYLGG